MLCRLTASATKLVSILVVLVGVQVVTAAEKVSANDKIKKLLEQRVAVRIEILNLVTAGYQQGSNDFDQVLEAQSSLLSARLDLCETKDQRLKVHEELVRAADTSLELAKTRFQAGEGPRVDVLKGQARVLEAQIGLENAKAAK